MSTSPDPQDGTDRPAGGDALPSPEQPAYYRPGPSSGYYPQYPQNPYGPGKQGSPPPQFSGSPYGQSGGYQGPTYPYGGRFQAGTGSVAGSAGSGSFSTGSFASGTASRPGNLVTALILLLVPPGLFLLVGAVLMFAPLTPDMFPPDSGIEPALAQSGLTMEQLLSALRTFGVVLAVLAVLYAVLAVVSFLGRFGALVTLTVLTVLFDLFWLVALLSAAANPVGAILPVIVLGCSLAGVWLMFTPQARAWFAARR